MNKQLNHEKLLSLYNQLDDILRERYKEPNRTISVFVRFTRDLNNSGVQEYKDTARKLNMIRVLRNNLIHELDMNSDNLIEVTDETIQFLTHLLSVIKHPKLASDVMTPLSKLYYVFDDADIKICEMMKLMMEKGYSQVPVLSHTSHKLIGVFSPNVLFAYLNDNKQETIEDVKLQELLSYTSIENHRFETYKFVESKLSVEECGDIFVKAYEQRQKLQVLFVTDSGHEKGPLKGIIVPADLY